MYRGLLLHSHCQSEWLQETLMPTDVLAAAYSAERTVLGTILVDNRQLCEVQARLRPEHFSSAAHRRIYSALCTLFEIGRQFEIPTIALHLQRSGDLDKVGDVAYLSDLVDGAIFGRDLGTFTEAILDAAKRRHLRAVCEAVGEQADDLCLPIDSSLCRLEDTILRLRTGDANTRASNIRDVVPEVLNEMEAMRQRPSGAIGLTTGLLSLDRSTTGIRSDEYWVVGALPSRGKTVLGIQIATANAKRGVGVLFFSHEMTRGQLVRRMLPGECGVPASRIRDPRYASESDYRNIQETAAQIAQWPLWVVDTEQLSARELVTIARLYIRRYNVKVIIADYLQLIDAPGRELRERVANASNMLRSIPKTEGVPVVALSQLARPKDRNESSRPVMTDLKESGAIEAHAHVVLLLYRPKNKQGEWTGEDEVIIAKQREGLVGYERVRLDGNKLQFLDRGRERQ
jgi:replicative DNA helicase